MLYYDKTDCEPASWTPSQYKFCPRCLIILAEPHSHIYDCLYRLWDYNINSASWASEGWL